MKRFGLGTPTLAVLVVLIGLITALASGRYFGPSAQRQPSAPAAKNAPTLAPPQKTPVLPTSKPLDRLARGQVIYIPVEVGRLSPSVTPAK